MFKVQARACPTCIYRSDSPLDIRKLEADVADKYGGFHGWRVCQERAAAVRPSVQRLRTSRCRSTTNRTRGTSRSARHPGPDNLGRRIRIYRIPDRPELKDVTRHPPRQRECIYEPPVSRIKTQPDETLTFVVKASPYFADRVRCV